MKGRRYILPRVIEMNFQAGQRLGVNVYLVDGGRDYILIDIGFEDTLGEIVDLIRGMDYSLSNCRMIIATHADADHIQAMARAKEVFKAPVAAHTDCVRALETADPILTFSVIKAQEIEIPLRAVKVDKALSEGDEIEVGDQKLAVWHTPGHAAGQLALKMGGVLFSGDNIYKDGSVGVIDAHHGSDIPKFIASLERIRDDDSSFLLPSHGPAFRKDKAMLERTIARLRSYLTMADFGTCATGWPLLDEWENDVISGRLPSL
ncbi:MAG: MBL fold metallo-hydrolase [Planctomycetes bacterium]|nr:MBL fold metallo-hydrolase [Planctomycetota bacterium]